MKGEELKRIRLKHGLTTGEIATLLKVPNKQLIYQWEKGIRNPSNLVQHIYKLIDSMDESSLSDLIENVLMAEV